MDQRWIHVKVHPHARKDVLLMIGLNRFEAWVKAKPMEGRATDAVLNLLVRTLRIPRAYVRLVKGGASRHKIFKIYG